MCKINGRKLEEIRVNAGVTKAELAKRIGVTGQTISNYENGITTPPDENVAKICMILKINQGEIEMQSIDYDFKNGRSRVINNERRKLGSNRLKKPSETEAFIFRNRTESEEKEKSNVKSALRQPSGIGNKKYILIDPTFIHIPSWQRDTDFAKAKEIDEHFDEAKFDPIKVYYHEGKLYVADGAHRLIAIILKNSLLTDEDKMMILVEVLDCDERKAITTFLGQQAGRKNMTINDMYRAAVENGEESYLALKNVCEENNIQITAEEKQLENPIGKIIASRTALRLADNKNLMSTIINLINDLNWTGSEKNAFTMRNFTVIKRLFSKYGECIKEKLLTSCKGAAFYEAKVMPVKSNAELFDVLVAEMNI